MPVGRWIAAPADIRQEGETTIYPVVEEVLVVEKRLRLVEEVHVTRRRATRQVREEVSLRHEEILVEHDASPDGPSAPGTLSAPGVADYIQMIGEFHDGIRDWIAGDRDSRSACAAPWSRPAVTSPRW